MSDVRRVGRELRKAAKAAKAQGLKIADTTFGVLADATGRFHPNGNCVCPIGAFLLEKEFKGDGIIDSAASHLGISFDDLESIYLGFDNITNDNDPYSYLGRRLRKEFLG